MPKKSIQFKTPVVLRTIKQLFSHICLFLALAFGLARTSAQAGTTLYVSQWGNPATIQQFDENGNGFVFGSFPSGFSAPQGMAWGPDGALWVTDIQYNTIRSFNIHGDSAVRFDENSGLRGPIGLAFDRDGFLYVANYGNNTIEKFDLSGNHVVFADSTAGLDFPNDLAFDANGNLFVTNFGDGIHYSRNTIINWIRPETAPGSPPATVPLAHIALSDWRSIAAAISTRAIRTTTPF